LKAIPAIVGGTFKVAAGSGAAGTGVGVGGLFVKVAAVAVVVGGIGAVINLSHRTEATPVPSAGKATASQSSVLFSDDFENGLSQWSAIPTNCSIVQGEGVEKSRCLRIMAGHTTTDLMPLFVSPQESIEVSFQIRFEYTKEEPVVGLGLKAGERDGGSRSLTPLVWLPLGHGGPSRDFLRGKWMRYNYVIGGKEVIKTFFSVGQQTYQWDSRFRLRNDIKGCPIGICLDALHGATIYIDDVVIRSL
jgi:hypothetical protein